MKTYIKPICENVFTFLKTYTDYIYPECISWYREYIYWIHIVMNTYLNTYCFVMITYRNILNVYVEYINTEHIFWIHIFFLITYMITYHLEHIPDNILFWKHIMISYHDNVFACKHLKTYQMRHQPREKYRWTHTLNT